MKNHTNTTTDLSALSNLERVELIEALTADLVERYGKVAHIERHGAPLVAAVRQHGWDPETLSIGKLNRAIELIREDAEYLAERNRGAEHAGGVLAVLRGGEVSWKTLADSLGVPPSSTHLREAVRVLLADGRVVKRKAGPRSFYSLADEGRS